MNPILTHFGFEPFWVKFFREVMAYRPSLMRALAGLLGEDGAAKEVFRRLFARTFLESFGKIKVERWRFLGD